MTIPAPNLDDRRFDDLVEEMLARIPAHTPEWTHPREGDPGRTLVELFAWLGDSLLYRANLIPDRQRLVFLRLLGQTVRPARAARTVVALALADAKARSRITLRAGARSLGPVPFETRHEITVLPLSAEAYLKRPLNADEAVRMGEVIQGLARLHGIRGGVSGYSTRPLFDAGRAAPEGVDVFAESLDRALWIALLAPEAQRGETQEAVNARVREEMGGAGEEEPALLRVAVVPAIRPQGPFEEIGPRARPALRWEITGPADRHNPVTYQSLLPFPGSDGTKGLTQAGTLALRLPGTDRLGAPSNDVGVNPMAGVGDTPPRLDDEAKASRLLAWLRLRPADGSPTASLRLAWVGVNGVEMEQRQTLEGQLLGQSNGASDQVFRLPLGQVDPDSLQIEVEDGAGRGYQAWRCVDDLAAISPDPLVARDAMAYELDPSEGTVRFGDGVRGRVPEAGLRIRLARGRFGGGEAGNLPAGSLREARGLRLDASASPTVKIHQPLACGGGAEAESLAEAERRIPARLRHGDRAVTSSDFERLSFEVQGLAVGRVEVLPLFKPHDRLFGMAGVVSVMALPEAPIGPPPWPRPDRPFLETLHAHLASRVPLTTELYVIGCEYISLGLATSVLIRPGFSPAQVLHDVEQALRRLLWPLPPGGAQGEGWALGRDVRDRELEVEISRVAGVLEVNGIRLFGRLGGDNRDVWQELPRASQDGSQTLELTNWQLPELLTALVVEGGERTGLESVPTSLDSSPNPFAVQQAVAVPIVPEVC
jgi:hypothetical protein